MASAASAPSPPTATHKWRVLNVGCKEHGCSERALEHAYGKCFDHKDPRLEKKFELWHALQDKKLAARKLVEARLEEDAREAGAIIAKGSPPSTREQRARAAGQERAVVAAREACIARQAALETQQMLQQMHMRSIAEQQTVLEIQQKRTRNKQQHAARDARQGSGLLTRLQAATASLTEANVARVRQQQAALVAQVPLKEGEQQEKLRRVKKQQARVEALHVADAARKDAQARSVAEQQVAWEAQQRAEDEARTLELGHALELRRAHVAASGSREQEARDVAESESNAHFFEQMQYLFEARGGQGAGGRGGAKGGRGGGGAEGRGDVAAAAAAAAAARARTGPATGKDIGSNCLCGGTATESIH